jgi:hypothetical protein
MIGDLPKICDSCKQFETLRALNNTLVKTSVLRLVKKRFQYIDTLSNMQS